MSSPLLTRSLWTGGQPMRTLPAMHRKRHTPLYIRDWRKHRGLTQEQLGEKIGLDGSQVSNLERGMRGYTQETLENIAAALGCEPTDLFYPPPHPPIVDLIRSLSEKDQKRAERMIRALMDETEPA